MLQGILEAEGGGQNGTVLYIEIPVNLYVTVNVLQKLEIFARSSDLNIGPKSTSNIY